MASRNLEIIVQMLRARQTEELLSINAMREYFETMTSAFPAATDVAYESVTAGGVPAEWILPPGAPDSEALLYLHGGGYAIGSVNTHRDLASRLAKAAQMRVLNLNYRLAPEHPFPAALDDALAAYQWLLTQGVKPGKIIIAGDSAGGGLTVATLVALRDRNIPLPAAAVCLSPWVDLGMSGQSMVTKASIDPMVTPDGVKMMAGLYLGKNPANTPLASPLYADLGGLPPLLIQVGTREVLLDDSVRLAERAKAAGVDVTIEPWEDMIHVWQFFASMLPEGAQAIERIGEFVHTHIR